MPLSWNEIRARATAFAHEWADGANEDADAKSFWDDFFRVFGIPRRRVAIYEKFVAKAGGKSGFIDLFWPKVLVAEHKSAGKNLDRAFTQAIDYFPGLPHDDWPRYVVVSDFQRFRITDLTSSSETEIALADLPEKITAFDFIAGYESRPFRAEDPVNIAAAERLADLHDALAAIGYTGHDLEVYLVRLLFCLFAEDTGIFMPRGAFEDFIRERTSEDGSDLAARLAELFHVLNTPPEKRLKTLDEQLAAFPYVNGKLFEETLAPAGFNSSMRARLLACCDLDWGTISPAIFGSLFQGIMNKEVRRNLGAHYTSEKNILKLIEPLFLDDLHAEYARATGSPGKLKALHDKIAGLNFLDPACGCGNFLIITYRELRKLELQIIKDLYAGSQQQLSLDAIEQYVRVNLSQFHGIEIEEWPSQIARVAMWLIEHQMNLLTGHTFGNTLTQIPLAAAANVVCANALRLDWNAVLPSARCAFVLGNPPFVGAKLMDANQRKDVASVFGAVKNGGLLDFVSAWYLKAADYMQPNASAAFVSTSSIVQGEQVGVLWPEMFRRGMAITFAHRTFRWSNEAKGVAAVHCVIVGFSRQQPAARRIFDYADVDGDPMVAVATNINPYLVDAPSVTLPNRPAPICPGVPPIGIGNKPIDGGNYLFTPDEKAAFLQAEPAAATLFRRWYGATEFLNNIERWCLFVRDLSPSQIRSMPMVRERIEAVRKFRLNSDSAPTKKLAETPTRFHVEFAPTGSYLLVPRHSSENRQYVPMGFMSETDLSGDANLVSAGASLYHFGVMSSQMHMSWVRQVCGRLESRYRYSAGIVYNNFPWPESPSDAAVAAVEDAARGVLSAREMFPDSTLADLYDPVSMPPELRKAHQRLDKAVDATYAACGGRKTWESGADRVAFLFSLYTRYTAGMLADPAKPAKASRKKKT